MESVNPYLPSHVDESTPDLVETIAYQRVAWRTCVHAYRIRSYLSVEHTLHSVVDFYHLRDTKLVSNHPNGIQFFRKRSILQRFFGVRETDLQQTIDVIAEDVTDHVVVTCRYRFDLIHPELFYGVDHLKLEMQDLARVFEGVRFQMMHPR